ARKVAASIPAKVPAASPAAPPPPVATAVPPPPRRRWWKSMKFLLPLMIVAILLVVAVVMFFSNRKLLEGSLQMQGVDLRSPGAHKQANALRSLAINPHVVELAISSVRQQNLP